MTTNNGPYEAIVIGSGVAGICQIKHLADHGIKIMALEAHSDLGGTWFKNRYPGCRFDSESYTYGFKFSQELLDEWHWKEQFSPQPENLKYLNFVADKFNLRKYFRFNSRVQSMTWNEEDRLWSIVLDTGEEYQTRFVVTCLGPLSTKSVPNIKGMDDFGGESFHTYDWPDDPFELEGRKVGIVGTGATGIQIIPQIAKKVEQLTVFQRHPNWSIPLNNAPISETEMADIRNRFEEIFDRCKKSASGFVHLPERRKFAETTPEERRALWDELYARPGFALQLSNYSDTFFDPAANRELSDYVEGRIRKRVDDQEVADKLIPSNHGFGMRRLPLETRYFEAYNRDNVRLVDLQETPIERVTQNGIQTAIETHNLDLIIYATGFEAMLGGFNKIDINGVDGKTLRDKWQHETSTYLGTMTHGFPNLLMVAGPQSVSGSSNYPRAIETGVEWTTNLLVHALNGGYTRIEASEEGENLWIEEVTRMQEHMPFSKVQSWFTGYNPNAAEGVNQFRYNAYWGGAPKYAEFLQQAADEEYSQIGIE